jgi:hypothetical protein
MIVVDSSIWIDYFNGKKSKKTDWLDESLGIEANKLPLRKQRGINISIGTLLAASCGEIDPTRD